MKKALFHKRLRNFEAFDEIVLKVVPRYKTSGLSGDQWRQSVVIQFMFKGEVIEEDRYTSMDAALIFLHGKWVEHQEPISDEIIKMEKARCDQPSCRERPVGKYRLKEVFSRGGERLDPKDQSLDFFRQFCAKHLKRGDCSREDCDTNYVTIEGMPLKEGAVDDASVSPSGTIVMRPDPKE